MPAALASAPDRAHPSLGLHAELQSELALLEDLHPVADPVVLAVLRGPEAHPGRPHEPAADGQSV